MQVDRMKIEKLTNKERDRLHKHGTCFFCCKDGHMARECPDKKKTNQTSSTNGKTKAHTTEVSKEKEDVPPSYKLSVSNVHATICAMTREKRE
jgi:hypothetical protein